VGQLTLFSGQFSQFNTVSPGARQGRAGDEGVVRGCFARPWVRAERAAACRGWAFPDGVPPSAFIHS
jgi:hypothetical protein